MILLLGNLLLALAWAALRGEFSLATLVTGYVLGYLVLLMLVKGGVLGSSRYVGKVSLFAGLAAFFVWELVRANLRVALDVATPPATALRGQPRPEATTHASGASRGSRA